MDDKITKCTNNNIDRARRPQTERLELLLEDAFVVAENSYARARSLAEDGVTKGILAWTTAAERAIGEIVRLQKLIGNTGGYDNKFVIEFMAPPPPLTNEPS